MTTESPHTLTPAQLDGLLNGTLPISDAMRRQLVDLHDADPALFARQRTSLDAPLPFGDFLRAAFAVLEPSTVYKHGPHIDAIVEHLVAVTDGQIQKLIINIPPRHMKSLLVSVFWPAWMWTFNPAYKFIFASYDQRLATAHSVNTRDLMRSSWYQTEFGDAFNFKGDENLKQQFHNDHGGHRFATSVTGGATGHGGDAIVVDDPHNVQSVDSDTKRQTVLAWWDNAMSTRINDADTGVHIVVMQRLHEEDLTGHLLERGGYEALIIPERYEPDRNITTSIGYRDWRSRDGELIWPNRFSEVRVNEVNEGLGPYQTAGQKQQRPSPAGGHLVKSEWWNWYTEYPDDFDRIVASWDMTFDKPDKKLAPGERSYVVGQIWGQRGADFYLLDQFRDRIDFVESCEAVEAMIDKWPEARAKLVENKANGPAIISALKRKYAGLIPTEPGGSKLARFQADVVPVAHSGHVYLPAPTLVGAWINEFVTEAETFPASTNDDQVDAMGQALKYMAGKRPLYVKAASARY